MYGRLRSGSGISRCFMDERVVDKGPVHDGHPRKSAVMREVSGPLGRWDLSMPL